MAARIWWLPAALAGALLLRPASAISSCEVERLESTTMEPYGPGTNTVLKDLGVDSIYIVHYWRYKDRRKHMEAWLDSQGLRAYFLTGWDREMAEDADLRCMWPSNKVFEKVALKRHFDASWLEVRELTLAMKHASAWYWAVKMGHRNIMVLEDDAVFAPDFISRIQGAFADKTFADNYDVLFMGSYGPDKESERVSLRKDGGNRGGVAYMLSQAGASHLIGFTPVIQTTADHLLSNGGDYVNPPPRRWMMRPWPAWQGSREQKPSFRKDISNRAFIWTPDMGPCHGPLCCYSPKFFSEYTIVEGIVPQEDSVRYTRLKDGSDGIALPRHDSRAAFAAHGTHLSLLGRSRRGSQAAPVRRH